ncbi:MAG TPA: ABC transporter ATP-binding protein [Nitrososphaerales archaeon]|nr:ABC transporter ATP-binding protein [Nitrososphaerales archaeon]
MAEAVEVEALSKVYKSGTQALNGVTLNADRGQLLTVIGRNGAGKTTMVRILTTQLAPSSGSARIMGFDVVEEPAKVRPHIALVPQEAQTNQSMSPWDYVYYLTKLEGFSSTEAKSRSVDALNQVGLDGIARKPCYSLSGGERRRAIVAAAIASNAEVLFLDEPTTGLDPIIRRQIWASLRNMVEKGRTIVLTTHLMEEAEMVSDKIAVVDHGMLVASGTPNEIKGRVKAKARVVLKGSGGDGFSSYGELVRLGDREILYLDRPEDANEIISASLSRGLSAEVSPVTLEDVFYKLLGGQTE